MKKVFFVLFCMGAIFHPVGLLYGYVLPAPYIIEQMISGMNLPQQFQVEQTLQVEIKASSVGDRAQRHAYEQVLRYRMPGMFRSDLTGDDISHIHISMPTGSITAIDKVIVSESEPWIYGYKEIFSYRTRKNLTDRLKVMGIDVDVSSIGRLDNMICYVIGAQYPDVDVPQLWIGRENYLPVRLVVTGTGGNSLEHPSEEIRFSKWKQFNTMWYPGEISFLESGNVVQKITVNRVGTNHVFEPGIFDIQSFQKSHSKEKKIQQDLSDDIRQEIEQFKRIFD
jgi:hypothetical protein